MVSCKGLGFRDAGKEVSKGRHLTFILFFQQLDKKPFLLMSPLTLIYKNGKILSWRILEGV
jgi:hypothetical protein